MSGTRERPAGPAPERRIAYEDVDDLIHTATRLMQQKDAAQDTLTPEELRRIGQELDIPPEYVDRAMEVLAQRRQEQEQARKAQEQQRQLRRARLRRLALGSAAALAALAVLLGLTGLSIRNDLNSTLANVERQRAQVRLVLERRERVQARYATSTPGPERDAQLSGADNRVSVEQRRYDELATTYNASATAFPATLVVPFTTLPPSVPLSNQVTSW